MTASFVFLPWLRTGLAGALGTPTVGAARASVTVTVTVSAGGDPRPVPVPLTLYGPGDVTGLDPRAVSRLAPKPGEADAEPSELPMVEFAEPDLPWRFTPAGAGDHARLRPWLVLCVLADGEITDDTPAGADGRLPAVTVASADSLPRLDQSWAWAHVQVDGFDPASESLGTVAATPGRSRSRLLAPRHLLPRTSYTALLVPAYERGRLAGLRLEVKDTVDGLSPAWTRGASNVRLPVYHRWSFATGDEADFELLARRLVARAVPDDTGLFDLDVSAADPALPPASAQPLRGAGALTAPAGRPGPWPDASRTPFAAALAAMLNQPALALEQAEEQPLVAPPLWGRWHAAQDRLSADTGAVPAWFHQLNADPRLRVAAGLGAEVVRRNDEQLMAAAWDQVEGILAANAQLRRAQLAREASVRLLANHLSTLDGETFLAVTAPLHARVASATTATVHELVRASPIPDGALDGQLRRLRRPAGPLRRRAPGPGPGPAPTPTPGLVGPPPTPLPPVPVPPGGLLDRLNRADLQAMPVPPTPSGLLVLRNTRPPGRPPILPGVDTGLRVAVHPSAPVHPAPRVHPVPPVHPLPVHPMPPAPPVHPPVEVPEPPTTVLVPTQPSTPGWRPGAAGGLLNLPGVPVHRPVPIGGDPHTDPAVRAAVARFQQAYADLALGTDTPAAAGPTLVPVDLSTVGTTVVSTLDPRVTVPAGIRHRLRIAPWVPWAAADPLEPIMAAPEFDTPMYGPLAELGHEWLLPGAGTIRADTVTLVRSNQSFVEAYLVGLSHEMARELLFHEFPTDQRGTYFPQFWDVRGSLNPDGTPIDPANLRDITPIHGWTGALGGNSGRVPPAPPDHVVLLVKAELLRRHPDTIVTAVAATVVDGERTLGTDTKFPVFTGRLDPDLSFFGFDLQPGQARGTDGTEGWFFVLAEHPTQPRFGLDADDGHYGATPAAWDDLNWAQAAADATALTGLSYLDLDADLPDTSAVVPGQGEPALAWHADQGRGPAGANGGDLAWITLRRPFRVAIHGSDLLPAPSSGGVP
jgi:hypothetical protein